MTLWRERSAGSSALSRFVPAAAVFMRIPYAQAAAGEQDPDTVPIYQGIPLGTLLAPANPALDPAGYLGSAREFVDRALELYLDHLQPATGEGR